VRDLHSRDPCQQVIDVVVAPQLAIGHDVQAGEFLVHQGRLDRHLMDLVEVLRADAPVVEVGLQALEPLGNGVRPDDRGGQQHVVSP